MPIAYIHVKSILEGGQLEMSKLSSKIQNLIGKGGNKNMKNILIALVLCIVMSTSAHAGISLYYSIPGVGTTGMFDRQTLTTVDATSNYAGGIAPFATFNDVGDIQIGAFTLNGVAIGSDANLNSSWEMTGRWDDLGGFISGIIPGVDYLARPFTAYTFQYTSGTATLWAGRALDGTLNANFGTGIGSNDDVASTFTDGILLATISLYGGNGSLLDYTSAGVADTGATFTSWDIIDVPSGVWFDAGNNDMEFLLEQYGWVEVNTLVAANVTVVGGGAPGTQILSRNTGDATYNIPEPTTVILLGSGLLGLAGVSFRKKA